MSDFQDFDFDDEDVVETSCSSDACEKKPEAFPFGCAVVPFDPIFITKPFPHIVFDKIGWIIAVNSCKKTIMNYFTLCSSPAVGVLFYKPHTQSFACLTDPEFIKIIAHKKIERYVVDTMESFEPSKWFLGLVQQRAEIANDTLKPRMYRSGGQLFANEFAGFLHADRSSIVEQEYKNKLQLLLEHIMNVWASGREEVYEYLLNWLAVICQGGKNDTSLYLKSPQGTGKGTVSNFFSKHVIGHRVSTVFGSSASFCNNFNSEFQGKVFCVVEEAANVGAKEWLKFSDTVKIMTTEPQIMIEKKGKDSYMSSNTVNIVINSNNNAVRVEADDRRLLVLDIDTCYVGNKGYFNNLHSNVVACADSHKIGNAMFQMLKARDVSKFQASIIPDTESKRQIIIDQLPQETQFLRDTYLACGKDLYCKFSDLYSSYVRYCEACERKPMHKNGFSKHLKEIGIPHENQKYNTTHTQLYQLFEAKKWINELDNIPNPM
jgi:hypothetical protein